ncbi:MAG TPA: TIGR03790 family protein, partial [Candidatus Kapabacteria bacterium]|nr:TIGR03790 family protein [Candidatus Kapabacteria bacterium]
MGATRILLATLCIGLARCLVADTGESVVVVYNSRMAESKMVADHYAAKRQVPSNQVISLALPEGETITRNEFEQNLQQPLWNELLKRKLWTMREGGNATSAQGCNVVDAKVRYIVLCYGVPLKINPDASRQDPQSEKVQPELRRNEAAVESELSLLPRLDQK